MLKQIDTTELHANIATLETFARESLLPIVEETFADGRKCRDCRYCTRETQPHGERTRECEILEGRGGNLSDCPGTEDL